jgi:hypothetical protein
MGSRGGGGRSNVLFGHNVARLPQCMCIQICSVLLVLFVLVGSFYSCLVPCDACAFSLCNTCGKSWNDMKSWKVVAALFAYWMARNVSTLETTCCLCSSLACLCYWSDWPRSQIATMCVGMTQWELWEGCGLQACDQNRMLPQHCSL